MSFCSIRRSSGQQQMPIGAFDPLNDPFVRSGANLPEIAVDPGSGNLFAVWEDSGQASGGTLVTMTIALW
jgi:hypothetical protein